jgi:hypothetical protein
VFESIVFFITLFNRREVALAHINQPIKHKLSRTMHFKLVMETKNICYLKKEDNADIVAVLQPLSGEMANNLKRNYSEKKYGDFVFNGVRIFAIAHFFLEFFSEKS